MTALAEKGTTKKLAVNAAADRAEATSAAAKAKPVAAPCVNACDEMPDVAAPQGTTPAGQRRFNFLYRASQAIDYGKHIGFEDAEPSEITLEIIGAAHGAASVWTDLVFELQQRAGATAGNSVMKAKADRATSNDPLALPEFLKRAAKRSAVADNRETPESIREKVGKFHTDLMKYCGHLVAWINNHHELDDEHKGCLMQALELCAGRFQQLAQTIDGR